MPPATVPSGSRRRRGGIEPVEPQLGRGGSLRSLATTITPASAHVDEIDVVEQARRLEERATCRRGHRRSSPAFLSVPTIRLAAGSPALRQIAGSSAASAAAVPTGSVSATAVTVRAAGSAASLAAWWRRPASAASAGQQQRDSAHQNAYRRDELEYRAGLLAFELIFVEVAVDLVVDRVELVEHLVLLAVEQVRADRADREAVAEALLDEDLEVGAVGGA